MSAYEYPDKKDEETIVANGDEFESDGSLHAFTALIAEGERSCN